MLRKLNVKILEGRWMFVHSDRNIRLMFWFALFSGKTANTVKKKMLKSNKMNLFKVAWLHSPNFCSLVSFAVRWIVLVFD